MKHYSTLIKEVFNSQRLDLGNEPQNTFVNRMPDMNRVYQRLMKTGQEIIISRYGIEYGRDLLNEIKETFYNLIPEMPLIRQGDPFLERQLIISTFYLATYKTLLVNKIEFKEISNLCEEIIISMLKSVSFLTRILTRKRLFSKNETIRITNSAIESQRNIYPDDFVFEFIPGKDTNNYGYVIKECAICKFYRKQKAEEFLPVVCNLNKIFSQAYDYKIDQSNYLSKGDDHCSIRYSKIN